MCAPLYRTVLKLGLQRRITGLITVAKCSTDRMDPSTKTNTPSSARAENRKLFTGAAHAETYHLYRPTYPAAVFEAILSFLTSSEGSSTSCKTLKMAVDMACGTGQATSPLAQHFDKVLGCDVSENQIKEAQRHNRHDNVEYRVAPAESMPFLADGSVDLVTCALAFHWVDPELVYPEVTRILRHGGVFAVYAYGLPVLETPETRDLFDKYVEELTEFTSPQAAILFNEYRDVKLPLHDITRKDDLSIERDIPLSFFIGYLRSWSPYQTLLQKHPDSDILEVLADKLKSLYSPEAKPEDDPIVHISYSVFILMGRKK